MAGASEYPPVPDAPDLHELSAGDAGREGLLWLLRNPGRAFAFDLRDLERIAQYIRIVYGLHPEPDARMITMITEADRNVGAAMRWRRGREAKETRMAGASAAGDGGARVPVAVPPGTRPPGGVGVALPMAAGPDKGVGGSWSF